MKGFRYLALSIFFFAGLRWKRAEGRGAMILALVPADLAVVGVAIVAGRSDLFGQPLLAYIHGFRGTKDGSGARRKEDREKSLPPSSSSRSQLPCPRSRAPRVSYTSPSETVVSDMSFSSCSVQKPPPPSS